MSGFQTSRNTCAPKPAVSSPMKKRVRMTSGRPPRLRATKAMATTTAAFRVSAASTRLTAALPVTRYGNQRR